MSWSDIDMLNLSVITLLVLRPSSSAHIRSQQEAPRSRCGCRQWQVLWRQSRRYSFVEEIKGNIRCIKPHHGLTRGNRSPVLLACSILDGLSHPLCVVGVKTSPQSTLMPLVFCSEVYFLSYFPFSSMLRPLFSSASLFLTSPCRNNYCFKSRGITCHYFCLLSWVSPILIRKVTVESPSRSDGR